MARNINADGGDVYRAVITSTPHGKPRSTWREGPYAKPGAARARVSFWRNHLTDPDTGVSYASGYVERAETTWRPLDEQPPTPSAAIAQAYRDAADEINALPLDYECDPGRGEAAELLRRRAAEIHPEPTQTSQ